MGPAGTDARHYATLGATLRLPFQVIVSSFAVVRSGRPFNITTGRDNNGDTLFADRPAFAQPSDPGVVATPFGHFNPNPGPGDQVIPRNYGREPAEVRMDLHLSKGIRIGPGATAVRLGVDVVNVANRANRSRLNGVVTSPAFASAKRALPPRRVELFLGISF
jgi:hypothetical protein